MSVPQKVITYDPSLLAISIDARAMDGLADGESFKVEHTSDKFTTTVGVKGAVQRARNLDPTGMITLTIMGGHRDNAYLGRKMRELKLDPTKFLTISALNAAGEEVVFCNDAWLENDPGMSAGENLSNREWKVKCGNLEMNHGVTE